MGNRSQSWHSKLDKFCCKMTIIALAKTRAKTDMCVMADDGYVVDVVAGGDSVVAKTIVTDSAFGFAVLIV